MLKVIALSGTLRKSTELFFFGIFKKIKGRLYFGCVHTNKRKNVCLLGNLFSRKNIEFVSFCAKVFFFNNAVKRP